MLLPLLAVIAGLVLLVYSADKFVEGASATAKHAGMPSLLIGIVIIGFGTSAPEMVVSAMAAADGNPSLALGNAYGSNITNIALILGITALISPIAVQSQIIRKELPLLLAVTLLAGWQLYDGFLSGLDAVVLLLVLFALMGWSVRQGLSQRQDILSAEVDSELAIRPMPLRNAILWLVVGLILLVISSRILVWGAVSIAQTLGVSDLIIGLTIVAIGTSLPELASSVMAAKKGEHDLALGNILGSNLFNTLAVVGIAAGIHPLQVEPDVLQRDWLLMLGLTVGLLIMGIGLKGQGRINRFEGLLLLLVYIGYTGYLGYSVIFPQL
ncbi:calcium/sodium antiporter [Lacimicrobium alkaliphilum]|uniref:Calcium:proton antiporter n=1 Tax=Lacimicrobium alkaliphilum TaxID=1526571 RepID=A0A0U3AEN2_9ALTE|nr:calcium/sodium antiporter [Lacimicrobium alkaliphilum]ALS99518.1 calcium:proton antiporter [Lacimicrobium alkaliphilum]